ncbi:MAG: hypothetical protein JO020_06650 [Chloroflexi bacterium]|nr:hypothetical protein [Chloroflexota bacterium]
MARYRALTAVELASGLPVRHGVDNLARVLRRYVARQWRAVALLITAATYLISGAPPVSLTQVVAAPSQLPAHFAFGVGAGQGDAWMPQTGIPWDYRMQYLAGGVNTGSGWETWNANGTFALNYANESAQHGYIPVFPYYELLQSSGSCGSCAENQKDITNLNTSSLMSAYYQNFALLMQRLGPGTYSGISGFGKTALVNVEPDFVGGYAVQAANNGTCFGFCTGQGNDPSLLKASVSSSGYSGVAAYPNTYAGFIQALAHLRDLYAPNVLLGLDVSSWATGDDIGLDSNPNTNVAALGTQVGTFLSKAGPHDLLFNDPLDRDAGQYKALYGQNRWWDRLNVSLPNFHRWEQYLQSTSTADGGKSLLLWQVPVGNQYFDTENNTNDHYQDNRPEYIFSHIQELIGIGVTGAIFAPGNSGNTGYGDSDNDGVVNFAPICTTDGVSSGQICNNHTATVSDDDGGFIRMSAQSYYQNPVSLGSGGGGGPTATPTPTQTSVPATYTSSATASPSTVAPGQTVAITASVTSSAAANVLVDVEVYSSGGSRVAQQFWDNQSFRAGQTRTYQTSWSVATNAATGAYSIQVGIFSPGWGTLYAWNANAGSVSVATTAPTATATPTFTPTTAPTPTFTPTTRPTNTPTPVNKAPSFASTGTASPATVARGGTETIGASVQSSAGTHALVDVEVYTVSGTKVAQQWWDNQAFSAGQTRSYQLTWAVPSTAAQGGYRVKVGVFSPGWGTLYNWNNSAAAFSVK